MQTLTRVLISRNSRREISLFSLNLISLLDFEDLKKTFLFLFSIFELVKKYFSFFFQFMRFQFIILFLLEILHFVEKYSISRVEFWIDTHRPSLIEIELYFQKCQWVLKKFLLFLSKLETAFQISFLISGNTFNVSLSILERNILFSFCSLKLRIGFRFLFFLSKLEKKISNFSFSSRLGYLAYRQCLPHCNGSFFIGLVCSFQL